MYHLYLTKVASGWSIEHPSGRSFARCFPTRGAAEARLRALGYVYVGLLGGDQHWQKYAPAPLRDAHEVTRRLARAFGRDVSIHV